MFAVRIYAVFIQAVPIIVTKNDVDFTALPDAPGVYKFLGPRSSVLYVGKATSLRDRVRSYFATDLAEVRSALVAKVVQDAERVEWEETDSVLEALLLESRLIKRLKPVGNTDLKDDRSFAYLVVTDELYPRLLVARERELQSRFDVKKLKALKGPFLSAHSLKDALKIIRKIFPFFDPPFPIDASLTPAKERTLRFNQTIGLYPRELDAKSYKRTVRNILQLFDAGKKPLLARLEREMVRAAKHEQFEEAAELKRQVFALKHIQDVTLIKDEYRTPASAHFRIEAYDVAHLRGSETRGVMTVVEDGEANPSAYRIFTVRDAGGDDLKALKEILERRLSHREWPYPQLIVIDGGRTHLAAARSIIGTHGLDSALVSVVKDERHRPREILGGSYAHSHEALILLANAEAHRFAIGRHRRALRKARKQ